MGMHSQSTRPRTARIVSRLALMGGTAAVAGAMTLAGAGTASAAGFHLFGHHSQKHAEHKLGITGSPGSESQATQSTQGKSSSTSHQVTHDATHQAATAKVSAEHHVGKTGSTTH